MIRNSTIIPKKKSLSCGHFDYNFSHDRCKSCASIQNTSKRVAAHDEKEDSESMANLRDDLDAIFSRYIRLKYVDPKTKLVKCFTCQKYLPVGQIQNGHYEKRGDMATRFLEENCRPQCEQCNRLHNDDEQPYTDALEKENPGICAYLKQKAREVQKFTLDELRQMIVEYRFKVKVLEKKLKTN